MISLDQVRLLEQKVENAVNKIIQLQKENAELKERCAFLESQAENLNKKVSDFECDQNEIEVGIANALERLNFVEDSVRSAVELDSSNTDTEDNSAVFEESFSETVESSDTIISTNFQEENFSSSEPVIDFQLESTENQVEEQNQETFIGSPTDDSASFGFNFDEPSPVAEEPSQNPNQFDIF